MAKRGRPTLYKPEYADQVEKLCLCTGATDPEVAEFFEVNVDTLYEWRRRYPEFSEAIKSGREVADQNVAKKLYHRAIGYEQPAVKIFMPAGAAVPVYAPYTEIVAPDVTAAIFWLKNRQRKSWRDKTEHEHSVDEGLALLLDAAKKR
jgi:transposase-like protein